MAASTPRQHGAGCCAAAEVSRAPTPARSVHLAGLIADAERLAGLLAAGPAPDPAVVADRLGAATRATVRLDGASAPPELATAQPAGHGSWLAAFPGRVQVTADEDHDLDATTARLAELEVLGAAAGLRADDLAEQLLTDPAPTLTELHRRLTAGLVSPERAGQLRRTEQVVQDGSIGRIVYLPVEPAAIAAELATLTSWLATTGAEEHALVTSGVLHLELLRIHPFDAANGRLARTAARLALRAGGLDPYGLAVAEPELAEDPLGYHEEVARTRHRRDHTIWLERWSEAVVAGLRSSARALERLTPQLPDRALAVLEAHTEPQLTLAEYRAAAGVDLAVARTDLAALLDAGHLALVPASRGLRYRRTETAPPPAPA